LLFLVQLLVHPIPVPFSEYHFLKYRMQLLQLFMHELSGVHVIHMTKKTVQQHSIGKLQITLFSVITEPFKDCVTYNIIY